jgi:hypothetical protein
MYIIHDLTTKFGNLCYQENKYFMGGLLAIAHVVLTWMHRRYRQHLVGRVR